MKLKIFRGLLAIVIPIVLVTIGINASDNIGDLSRSLIGSLISSEPDGPCSRDMVFVESDTGGFCIDRYEASAGEDCLFMDPGRQADTRANIATGGCVPVSEAGKIPWRNISQTQALEACMKAGKRLPTNKEWYRGAIGTLDLPGSDGCNISKSSEQKAIETGSRESCVSYSGAYDMVGNAWEWVDAVVYDGAYEGRELPEQGYITAIDVSGVPVETTKVGPDVNYNNDYFWNNPEGTHGVFRGGFWGNNEKAGLYAMQAIASPSFVVTGLGFRCAK